MTIAPPGKDYSQVWMAENLNYAYLQPTDSLDSSSFCYNDSLEYCEKYGRLYTWAAAVDSALLKSASGWKENTYGKESNGVDAFALQYCQPVIGKRMDKTCLPLVTQVLPRKFGLPQIGMMILANMVMKSMAGLRTTILRTMVPME